MNKAMFFGRLVRDPEFSYTSNQKGMTKATIAVDRIVQKGQPKEADFIPLILWGKQAEVFANNLSKGNSVLVVGKIRTGNYVDKNGVKRYTTDVWVDEFFFTERKNSQGTSQDGGFESMGTTQTLPDSFSF